MDFISVVRLRCKSIMGCDIKSGKESNDGSNNGIFFVEDFDIG